MVWFQLDLAVAETATLGRARSDAPYPRALPCQSGLRVQVGSGS
jgi:hypothetical protein